MRAAQKLPVGTTQNWLRLSEVALPPFEDRRHAPGGFADDELSARLLEATLRATDLVFASPVYWYGLPAATKLYLDHWSAWLRAPGADFRPRMAGRRMWVVTTFSDESPSVARPLVEGLQLTASYMNMRLEGVLATRANRPGDVLLDAPALERADTFFASPSREWLTSSPPIAAQTAVSAGA